MANKAWSRGVVLAAVLPLLAGVAMAVAAWQVGNGMLEKVHATRFEAWQHAVNDSVVNALDQVEQGVQLFANHVQSSCAAAPNFDLRDGPAGSFADFAKLSLAPVSAKRAVFVSVVRDAAGRATLEARLNTTFTHPHSRAPLAPDAPFPLYPATVSEPAFVPLLLRNMGGDPMWRHAMTRSAATGRVASMGVGMAGGRQCLMFLRAVHVCGYDPSTLYGADGGIKSADDERIAGYVVLSVDVDEALRPALENLVLQTKSLFMAVLHGERPLMKIMPSDAARLATPYARADWSVPMYPNALGVCLKVTSSLNSAGELAMPWVYAACTMLISIMMSATCCAVMIAQWRLRVKLARAAIVATNETHKYLMNYLCHELRNPLHVCLAHLDLALPGIAAMPSTGDAAQFRIVQDLHNAHEAGARMALVLEDIMDMSLWSSVATATDRLSCADSVHSIGDKSDCSASTTDALTPAARRQSVKPTMQRVTVRATVVPDAGIILRDLANQCRSLMHPGVSLMVQPPLHNVPLRFDSHRLRQVLEWCLHVAVGQATSGTVVLRGARITTRCSPALPGYHSDDSNSGRAADSASKPHTKKWLAATVEYECGHDDPHAWTTEEEWLRTQLTARNRGIAADLTTMLTKTLSDAPQGLRRAATHQWHTSRGGSPRASGPPSGSPPPVEPGILSLVRNELRNSLRCAIPRSLVGHILHALGAIVTLRHHRAWQESFTVVTTSPSPRSLPAVPPNHPRADDNSASSSTNSIGPMLVPEVATGTRRIMIAIPVKDALTADERFTAWATNSKSTCSEADVMKLASSPKRSMTNSFGASSASIAAVASSPHQHSTTNTTSLRRVPEQPKEDRGEVRQSQSSTPPPPPSPPTPPPLRISQRRTTSRHLAPLDARVMPSPRHSAAAPDTPAAIAQKQPLRPATATPHPSDLTNSTAAAVVAALAKKLGAEATELRGTDVEAKPRHGARNSSHDEEAKSSHRGTRNSSHEDEAKSSHRGASKTPSLPAASSVAVSQTSSRGSSSSKRRRRRRRRRLNIQTGSPVGAQAGPATPLSDVPPEWLATQHVAVVDDEKLIRLTTSRLLSSLGVSFTLFDDGTTFLEDIDNRRGDAKLPYTIVLLDIVMRHSNGIEVCKTLRNSGVTVPVYAMTANSDPASRRTYAATGFNGVLAKPFTRADLARTVAMSMGIVTPQPAATPVADTPSTVFFPSSTAGDDTSS